jgi:hypothetical protein
MAGGTGAAATVRVTGIVFDVVPLAVTVIVAFIVPAARPAVLTLAVTAPLPEPDAGLKVSQVALSLADQLRVPPPVLLMLSTWAAGLLPFCVAANEKLVGLAPMADGVGAAAIVRATGMVLDGTPLAVTVMVAFTVPAARPAVFTLAVTAPLPEPDAGLKVSQVALSLADQLRVPLPVLLTLSTWAAGLLPFCVVVNDRLVGARLITGIVLPVTVKVMGTHMVLPPPAMTAHLL